MDYDDFTWIGTITKAHGLKGEVKIWSTSDTPEYYLNVENFWIERDSGISSISVLSMRLQDKIWITRFQDINTRNQAEELKGCRVLLEDDQIRPLEPGEFFQHQIIGCTIEDLHGTPLGKVTEILETGANHVYTVQGKEKEFLIPAIPAIIKNVDIEQKIIQIDPMSGLLD